MSNDDEKREPGRPALPQEQRQKSVTIRLHPELIAAVDDYISEPRCVMTRSDLIRNAVIDYLGIKEQKF